MKYIDGVRGLCALRRPPRGGRGLKSERKQRQPCIDCRPPRGGRGLKSWWAVVAPVKPSGRPPRGGRGLKYDVPETARWIITVAPLAGGVD